MLLGLPLGNDDVGYTNSAAAISAATIGLPGGFYRYDKHHLVPFGEFVPNGFHWFVQLMNIPLGDFNRGPVGPASFAFHGERIGANICYEDLFGEELAARFENASAAPTIFANISNIGWFGDTSAITQHLQISRMRTLEFQVPMLRAHQHRRDGGHRPHRARHRGTAAADPGCARRPGAGADGADAVRLVGVEVRVVAPVRLGRADRGKCSTSRAKNKASAAIAKLFVVLRTSRPTRDPPFSREDRRSGVCE